MAKGSDKKAKPVKSNKKSKKTKEVVKTKNKKIMTQKQLQQLLLKGKKEDEPWFFEGGHTGEFGLSAPRYFDEVRERSRRGEGNPAKYLF